MGDVLGKLIDISEEAELGAHLDQFDGESVEAHAKNIKDFFNFFFVALPVLSGKSPESDIGDFIVCEVGNDWFNGVFDGSFVALDRVQATVSGPATVAIHDNGDVF